MSSGTRFGEFQRSVILDGAKYIFREESKREELYLLDRDPGEKVSVINEHPEILRKARKALEEHEKLAATIRRSSDLEESSSEVAEEMRRRLRSLGYL